MIFRHRCPQRCQIVGSVGSSGLAGWRWPGLLCAGSASFMAPHFACLPGHVLATLKLGKLMLQREPAKLQRYGWDTSLQPRSFKLQNPKASPRKLKAGATPLGSESISGVRANVI